VRYLSGVATNKQFRVSERVRAASYAGAASWLSGNDLEAKRWFQLALSLNPNCRMDTRIFMPYIVAAFERCRTKM